MGKRKCRAITTNFAAAHQIRGSPRTPPGGQSKHMAATSGEPVREKKGGKNLKKPTPTRGHENRKNLQLIGRSLKKHNICPYAAASIFSFKALLQKYVLIVSESHLFENVFLPNFEWRN